MMKKSNLPLSTTGIFIVIKVSFKILSVHKVLFFFCGERKNKTPKPNNLTTWKCFCLIGFEGLYKKKNLKAFWPKPKTFQHEKKFQLLQCTVDGCNLQTIRCVFQIIMIFLHDFKLESWSLRCSDLVFRWVSPCCNTRVPITWWKQAKVHVNEFFSCIMKYGNFWRVIHFLLAVTTSKHLKVYFFLVIYSLGRVYNSSDILCSFGWDRMWVVWSALVSHLSPSDIVEVSNL